MCRQPPLKHRTQYNTLLVDWGHVPLVSVQGRRASLDWSFKDTGCSRAASSSLSLSVND